MLTIDHAVGMIERLDGGVFQVATQTLPNDRISLLRLQNLSRSAADGYVYLEVGSHLGGSLFPHLIDPHCRAAFSIDPRPALQADERSEPSVYSENSTARMISTLSDCLPPGTTTKLVTIESDVSDVRAHQVEPKATLALIDGEHTNRACFSDFVGLMPLMKPDCLICFHDSNLIADAILNAERYLDYLGLPHETVFLPDAVAAIGLGSLAAAVRDGLGPFALHRGPYLERSRQELWAHIGRVQTKNLQAELNRLRVDNARLLECEKHRADLEAEADRRRFEEARLVQEIERAQQAQRAAEARFSEIAESTTWRATAPVRVAVYGLKRWIGVSR
ncbi:class I SAM-dependent methyltransferase [Mesorhizobium sp. GbtcB19]|uniref:class I SAM-dependent methyltransferase n=1 Tax=Mesorhizobium sp. GbtcB19 TaxID=2824764 RepID=UPI001C2F27B6|nr:class I SAM-dependent methyltransferase [Mesorhizobium sp. GbtcB19]